MATVSFTQFAQGATPKPVNPKTPLASAVDKEIPRGSKDNYTRYSNVPGVSQLSNFGVGVGAATGSLLSGAAKVGLKTASALGKAVGADTTYADQYVEGAEKSQKFFGQEGEFADPLSTTSGKVGTAVGNTAPYLLAAGAANPATMGYGYGAQVAARTLPDVAIAAAQSGGDLKQTGTAGLISAASNALLPGSGGSVDSVKNFLKTEAKSGLAGYTSDVVQGLSGNRGEDRTGVNAFKPGIGTGIGLSIPVAQVAAQGVKAGVNKVKDEVTDYLSKDRIVKSLEDDINKIAGETKSGIKNIQKSNKMGKDPARVLAESGIQPNKEGLKFRTEAQADEFIKANTPKLEAVLQDGLAEADIVNPQGVPLSKIRRDAIDYINSQKIPELDKKYMMQNASNTFDALQEKYGDSIKLGPANIEKRTYWANTKFDPNNPFKKDINYAVGRAFKGAIEEGTQGLPVAKINEALGDIYDAGNFLKSLDGNAVKGGRLGKYVYQFIGSTLGETLPAKIAGAFVGDKIFSVLAEADDPVKTLILKGLQKNDPQAYTEALQFIADQRLERSLQPKLGPGNPLGSEKNPFIGKMSDAETIRVSNAENPVNQSGISPEIKSRYATSFQSPEGEADPGFFGGVKPKEVADAQNNQINERAMDFYNRVNQPGVKTMASDMRSSIENQPLLTKAQLEARTTPLKPMDLDQKYDYFKKAIKSSDALNIEKSIASGDITKDMVYKGNTKILTPEFAEGRINDIAQKLEAYDPKLGDFYKKSVAGQEMTLAQLIKRGQDILENKYLGLSLKKYLPKSTTPLIDGVQKKNIDNSLAEIALSAKKYNSAEEFVNSFGVGKGGLGSGVEYTPIKRTIIEPHQTSLADILGRDDTVTVYRGVDRANQKNIVGGDYVATSRDLAQTYTGEGKVIGQKVNLKDIFVDRSDGFTPKDIQDYLNGKEFHAEANYIPKPITKSQLRDIWEKVNKNK